MEGNLIKSKLPSIIKSNTKIFISIALIASMGMITLIALLSSYQTLTASLEDFRLNYGFPDITISTSLLTEDDSLIDRIKEIDGVDSVETRMVADMQLTRSDGRGLTGRMMGYIDNDLFNTINVIESGGQGDGIGLSADQYFAGLNELGVGDSLDITVNGETHSAYVERIVSAFESTSVTRNDFTYFDTMDFGYVYLENQDLEELLNSPVDVSNQIFVSVKDTYIDTAVLEEIENLEASEILDAYTYEDSPQKSVLDSSVIPLKTLSFAIPPLLYLITLLITYLFIYQVIQEQRHEIGVLRALGFSSAQIRNLYFAFSLAISAVSAVIGIPAGLALTWYVSDTYKIVYGIPELQYVYDIRVMVLALVVTTLTGLMGTYISAKSILKISPAEAMREKSAQQVSAPAARKLVASFNSVAKVAISSSLRNKRRVFISLLSVILTSLMILVSLSYSFAVRDILEHTFNDRYLYDAQIFFDDATDQAGIELRLDGFTEISEIEAVGMKSVTISYGDMEEEALVCGLQPETSMITVSDASRNTLTIPAEGIILEDRIATDLGLAVGDKVIIEGKEILVSAISKENINYTQYCSLESFEELFGAESINSALVTMTDPADEIGFYNALSGAENFDYLSFNSIQEQSVASTFATTNAGVYTIIICAFIVGSLIIYNMSLINIKERLRDYAIMRVLGISPGAIARGTYLEILIQFIISIIIGLGLGNVFADAMLQNMNSANITYFNANTMSVFVLIALAVFAFMSFGHFLAVTRIYKLDLIESLKTRE
ncbi:FtsX-like permease family protein [Eubacteriaceae bacterium ES3]|nr:FtsX-like permease family protein [Eubacteriaceae bacterium ES3]